MDIDKDIEILKENIDKGIIYVGCGNTVEKAIENVLKELETYKKIAEKLAEEVFLHISFAKPTEENIKILIENARKEVEKDAR